MLQTNNSETNIFSINFGETYLCLMKLCSLIHLIICLWKHYRYATILERYNTAYFFLSSSQAPQPISKKSDRSTQVGSKKSVAICKWNHELWHSYSRCDDRIRTRNPKHQTNEFNNRWCIILQIWRTVHMNKNNSRGSGFQWLKFSVL